MKTASTFALRLAALAGLCSLLPAAAGASTSTSTDAATAADHAQLERTRILGQRELPKVLTIVPWKKPLAVGTAPRPLRSVLDEALAPVDRSVLRRELNYHGQLRARSQEGSSTER